MLQEAIILDEFNEAASQGESADRQHALILSATLADPLASEPYRLLARETLEKWLNVPGSATKERFEGASSALLRLRPQSNSAWLEAGEWRATMFDRSHDPDDGRLAVEYTRRAVELYPTSASNRAALADLLAITGDKPGAAAEAAEALRLDELTPHADKKLKPESRERMRRMIAKP